jgi:hypothetical protein
MRFRAQLRLLALRGIEPLALAAEIGSELRRMFDQVVSSTLDVLRICVGVLRLLQKTMGHASITVTTHYADLYDNSTTSPRHSMPSTMPAATFRNHPPDRPKRLAG